MSLEYYASSSILPDRYIITTGVVTALFANLMGSILPQVHKQVLKILFIYLASVLIILLSYGCYLLDFGFEFS